MMFFPEHEISEMRGPTGLKFCMMVSTRPNFIMPVQNFLGRTPKEFQGPKTCKIWPDFGRLQSSVANISDFSCIRRNKSSEVWSSDLGDLDVESYPPKLHFSEDHISAPGGAAPPNFYTR